MEGHNVHIEENKKEKWLEKGRRMHHKEMRLLGIVEQQDNNTQSNKTLDWGIDKMHCRRGNTNESEHGC